MVTPPDERVRASHDNLDRGAASLPYTLMMLGFAFGTIVLGRMADRTGIVVPVVIAGSALGLGFVLAGLAPNLPVFSAAHLMLIGVGAWRLAAKAPSFGSAAGVRRRHDHHAGY